MGIVRTAITLKNARDIYNAQDGIIKEPDIRQTTVNAVVDTGAWTMVINEEIRKELGLMITRTRTSTLADGKQGMYNLAGPLEVTWKDRSMICEAIVLPKAENVLVGAIPLEAMDLTINPLKEEVVGAHGDEMLHILYSNL